MSFSTNINRSSHASILYDSIHKPRTSSIILNQVQPETISPMHISSKVSTNTIPTTNIQTPVGQASYKSQTSTNSSVKDEDRQHSTLSAASAASGSGSAFGSGAGSNNRSRFPMLSSLLVVDNSVSFDFRELFTFYFSHQTLLFLL